jgi:hypothetical protein
LDRVEVKGGEERCNAFRMAHRYPHRQTTLKQTMDDALAEKTSPAEDGHLYWRHCSFPRDAVLKCGLWTPLSGAHLQLHQPLGRKADHLAQDIRVWGLLHECAKVRHLVGHW